VKIELNANAIAHDSRAQIMAMPFSVLAGSWRACHESTPGPSKRAVESGPAGGAAWTCKPSMVWPR